MDKEPHGESSATGTESIGMGHGWRFNKELNLGHVLILIGTLTPVFWWGSTVETRLTVLSGQQQAQVAASQQNMADLKDRMDRDSRATAASFQDIKDWLKAIREDMRQSARTP